jgi:cellulose synthase/poly-beta-1,6-N-acetylglucosamine synthase-like glycosyltransferase
MFCKAIFVFTLASGCIYSIILLIIFLGLLKKKKINPSREIYQPVFVSVVLAARNEENNIARCLKSLFNQTYKKDLYEIIMVDDNSTDNTFSIADSISREYKNFKLLKPSSAGKITGKQQALDTGILASKGEIILTVDADCEAPPRWIEDIVKEFDPDTGLVAGYSVFNEDSYDQGFLRKIFVKLQLLELLSLYFFSIGSILQGIAWTCTGNNLSYRRKLYDELGGFKTLGITGLEDNMLIQWVGRYTNWKIKALYSSIVYTQHIKTVSKFFVQRMRWASSGSQYRLSLVLFLVTSYLFYLLTFLSIGLSVSGILPFKNLIIILSLKMVPELLLISRGLVLFNKLSLLIYFPLIQPTHLVYILVCGIHGLSNTFVWKGRKYGS